MDSRKVNNKVRIAGKIVYIRNNEKNAIIVVDTGKSEDGIHNNYPRTVAFEKVLHVAKQYKVGDYVLIDATLQANKGNRNLPSRTIAVNHISRLNPDDPKYHTANSVDLYGRVSEIKKVSDTRAKAIVAVYTTQINYIVVYFDSDNKDKFESFCALTSKDFVHLMGKIKTSRVLTSEDTVKYFENISISHFKVLR